MMNRGQTAAYLKEEADEARLKVERALLKWENGRRRDARMPELPKSTVVWLPTGPDSDLRLITLVVWSRRHRVSLVWLLDAVLTRFRSQRKLPRAKHPEELTLGIPAATLVCDAARASVEERLLRDFPDGENLKAARQPRQSPMPELPDGDMLAEYLRALAGRTVPGRRTVRPYRRT